MRLWPLSLLACALLACAHSSAPAGGGTDDEVLDRYTARFEELRSRAALAKSCPDTCQIAREGCEAARSVCEVTARHPDRKDLPPRCTVAQESCAHFNDGCAGCQGR